MVSGIELDCINFVASGALAGEKVFEKRALRALRALPKARRTSVQLWEAGRFQEIVPALLRPFTPFLPPMGAS